MEDAQKIYEIARESLINWQLDNQKNCYTTDPDYIHTLQYNFNERFSSLNPELEKFGQIVVSQLEPLVNENNLALNLPRLEHYNAIGNRIDNVIYHPAYIQAGDLIYQTKLLAK